MDHEVCSNNGQTEPRKREREERERERELQRQNSNQGAVSIEDQTSLERTWSFTKNHPFGPSRVRIIKLEARLLNEFPLESCNRQRQSFDVDQQLTSPII